MKVTKHVSYSEIVNSATAKRLGIENIPSPEQYANIKLLCKNIFEPTREELKVAIYISSCFRSTKLNKALKGAKGSQHMADNGAAMDLDADRYGKTTNAKIFHYIKDNLDFDQLIWEFGDGTNPAWVHVSYKNKNNRKQVLVAYKNMLGKTSYKQYV
jgi:hypothetical protein